MGQKLSHAQFNEYSMLFRCGHARRKRDLEEVLRSEREKAIDKHLKQERESLCNVDPDKPMREFPELTTFVTSFTRSLRWRPIVLIVGGTNLVNVGGIRLAEGWKGARCPGLLGGHSGR